MPFSDGDRVLCYHGPLLYEAKCMKSEKRSDETWYYVHYSGWNKNWDEWVPESRVLEYKDQNVQKQKELEAACGTSKRSKNMRASGKKESLEKENPVGKHTAGKTSHELLLDYSKTHGKTKENLPEASKKPRGRQEKASETVIEAVERPVVEVRLPNRLKHALVDDWNLIMRQHKRPKLPAKVTVEDILNKYVRVKTAERANTPNKETIVHEVTGGIRQYFNTMLGTQLLYKLERPQYNKVYRKMSVENPDLTPAQVYGAIYLVRLLSKLGDALSHSVCDAGLAHFLQAHVRVFVMFLTDHFSEYFDTHDYINEEDV